MRLKFDSSHNVLSPTLVLAKRNGRKLGAVPASNIHFTDRLNSYTEISFQVYKYDNNTRCNIWYQVESLKLVFCPEWNMWFEIRVEINEDDTTIKNVEGRSLGEAELSQALIHTTEINTEDDILRDDYKPTVLWNAGDPQASLLNRIMEKVPHYRIKHVDESIKRIQRTFSFDNISVYDAFQEIAEEIKCLFVIETKTTDNKPIDRTVSVYDLETVCNDCGCRGEFIDTCSKCGSKNVKSGYGNDTTIFISTDNLADNINYSVDVDSVKNCFKLAAGDDLMTATIRNCNPNGSDYIWFFDPRTMENMSKELTSKLDEYNSQYEYYQTQYKFTIDPTVLKEYNDLVDKYVFYNDGLKLINGEISGFASLMDAFYNTINFGLYLSDGMMPSMDLPETTAQGEAQKLNAMNLSAVAVMDTQTASEATVTSAALSYARVLVDSRYQVKVNEGSFGNGRWSGNFKITRYSDDNDTAISNFVTVTLSDDYGTFVKQKIDKLLAKEKNSTAGIVTLFGLADTQFKAELKKYCLASLTSFYECCQSCIDILIEQGVGDSTLWADRSPNLYEIMYLPYRNKLVYIKDEIAIRENEIAVIEGKYDKNGAVEKVGMQSILSAERNKIQSTLDFQSYLGNELWEEFSSYRRESLYKNDNYISDGLNDTELFKNALEFLENARKELYKSSVLQHSISSTLKNLLVMKAFEPIVNYFDVGNWIRIRVDDKVYKLRLIEYEVDFDNLDTLSVEFSDVMETADGISDFDSILKKAMSMSSSYGSVAHQAEAGNQSFKQLNDWVDKGLNVTNQRIVSSADNQNQVWDEHGMLLRKYDEISESYEDEQIKFINSTLSMTNDNWQTVKTAIGKYYFFDPTDNFKLKIAYGVIAETIVGKMILGEQLGIYTDNGSMSFDKDGLNITNGINNFKVNPNSNELMTISNSERDLLRFDENGQLYISGDGSALDINANDAVTGLHSRITQTAGEIRLEVEDVNNSLSSLISQTEEKILLKVEDVDDRLSASIEINADQISSLVTKTDEQERTFTEFAQGYDNFKTSVVTIDNSGNFIGTQIEQNSEHIRVAWNQCSDYIQFENGELNIYNESLMSKFSREGIEVYDGNSTPLSKLDQYGIRVYGSNDCVLSQFDREGIKVYNEGSLVMKLDWTGTNYYFQDRKIGNIGLGVGEGDLSGYYGMIMGVTDSNDFVGFGEPNPNGSDYRPVLAYYGHRDEIWAHKPMIIDGDLDMKGHKICNAVIEGDGEFAETIDKVIFKKDGIEYGAAGIHEVDGTIGIVLSMSAAAEWIGLLDSNGEKILEYVP